jgi:hypothetical protein
VDDGRNQEASPEEGKGEPMRRLSLMAVSDPCPRTARGGHSRIDERIAKTASRV